MHRSKRNFLAKVGSFTRGSQCQQVPLIMELNAAVATGNSWRVLTDARLVALAKALGPVRQR